MIEIVIGISSIFILLLIYNLKNTNQNKKIPFARSLKIK